MPAHKHYMQRAIALAKKASGQVTPNPLVGCVVVNHNKIVGEGYHQVCGQAHAEVNALNDAGKQAKGSTIYVTLEPCSHKGKTPPCANAIINAGVSRVVYAVADPNPTASGGAALLREHGIETIQGLEENAAQHLARFFLHHVRFGTPYVVAKYASSIDGKIACHTGNSQWITGELARHRSHELRQSVDGILVGAQTVIDDNPSLTVRLPETTLAKQSLRNPIRFVLDSTGRVPLDSALFQTKDDAQTQVLTTERMPADHVAQLENRGVTVTQIDTDPSTQRVSIPAMLNMLGKQGVQSIMVEGGQSVLGALMDQRAINETWAFFAPKFIGGAAAPGPIGGKGIDAMPQAASLCNVVHEQLGNDWLIRGDMQYMRGCT
ncbi:MAG: bifunctional diaminohydroxyphosphoribosylaminopyrimidine deaminase/5-amino-6-(5-phosphoribosylamino)uracil reductase RibD [Granulosicoccaceae bacterium]